MTTFFQMAQSMDPGQPLDLRRLIELGPQVQTAPQSALLLNPIHRLGHLEESSHLASGHSW
ncbi:MAG: hypothetical protein AAFY88_14580 [Acidobacteriota bacterium]